MLAMLFAALIAAPVQLSLAPGGKIVIEGDSSAHAWKCQASGFDGAGEAQSSEEVAGSLSAFEIGVPVRGISCGHDSMDEKLRDALKADKFARIDFTFTSAALQPGAPKLKLIGKLAIAGVEKNVTTVVAVSKAGGNIWTASGAVHFKMSDFGVEPPSAMLGLMKTADPITIRFELKILANQSDAERAGHAQAMRPSAAER